MRKKGGKLRLIIDAREVNRCCKPAPSVSPAGPEVLASLECNPDEEFHISLVDIKDCFHRLRLTDEMSDSFALPGGFARDFGVQELNGQPIDPDTWIYPACACVPMGFSWSVFLAQSVAI